MTGAGKNDKGKKEQKKKPKLTIKEKKKQKQEKKGNTTGSLWKRSLGTVPLNGKLAEIPSPRGFHGGWFGFCWLPGETTARAFG